MGFLTGYEDRSRYTISEATVEFACGHKVRTLAITRASRAFVTLVTCGLLLIVVLLTFDTFPAAAAPLVAIVGLIALAAFSAAIPFHLAAVAGFDRRRTRVVRVRAATSTGDDWSSGWVIAATERALERTPWRTAHVHAALWAVAEPAPGRSGRSGMRLIAWESRVCSAYRDLEAFAGWSAP